MSDSDHSEVELGELRVQMAVLAKSVEQLVKMQTEMQECMKTLTQAQTELIITTKNFEAARAEDHRRQDNFETHLENLEGRVNYMRDTVVGNEMVAKTAKKLIWLIITSSIFNPSFVSKTFQLIFNGSLFFDLIIYPNTS